MDLCIKLDRVLYMPNTDSSPLQSTARRSGSVSVRQIDALFRTYEQQGRGIRTGPQKNILSINMLEKSIDLILLLLLKR